MTPVATAIKSLPLLRRSRALAIACALVALLISVAGLLGWYLQAPYLKGWFPRQVALKTNEAVALAGAALAALLLAAARRWSGLRLVAAVLALGVAVLAGATLLQDAAGWELGIDQALAREPAGATATGQPNRMAPVTTLGLLLVVFAQILQAVGHRRVLHYAQGLGLAAIGTAAIVITGYAYGLEVLVHVPPFSAASLPGALALALLGFATVLARPSVGVMPLVLDTTAGGTSMRRLLPLAVGLVFLLGAARVWGERQGWFAGPSGSAVLTLATGLMLAGLIAWHAQRLRDAERRLRRQQEAQAELQRQFREAVVAAPIPILMFAEDGRILQTSRTIEELTGYTPIELPDLDAWSELTRGGDGEESPAEDLLLALDGPHEVQVRTRAGSTRTWRLSTSTLGTLPDGRQVFVTMGTDITELREADRRKDEFLAVLGHELRNPLAALASGIELLGTPGARSGGEDLASMMRRQVRHLSRLIDDLLDVSRISRGKIELAPQPLDLGEAVERAVDDHREVIERSGHRLSVSQPPQPVPVEADPTRLHQMLTNLIGNAVKYTDDGGRIWVTVEREEGDAVVRVRDTGIGMSPDMTEAAFEPFQQFHRHGGRSQGGLGLGLTLVRQLAEMHDGSVHAASRGTGTGCTFTLRLPLAEALPSRPRPAARSRGQTPLRIVVVDDQTDVADSFTQLLELSGHAAVAAYDGAQALAAIERHAPQVVLLDLDLPDVDGHTLAERIRAARPDPPVLIAVSGYGGEGHRRRSQEVGISHHLVKPVDLDQVLALLQEVAVPAA